jgi:gamma-glutamyl-gamma-aminobutyrate hydrolase PuuD
VQLVSEIGSKPLVGVISDHRVLGGVSWHLLEEHYLTVLARVAGVVPVAIPALGLGADLDALVQEINVALGGSLHQDLELAGFNGHRDSAAAIFSAFADACNGDGASGGDD